MVGSVLGRDDIFESAERKCCEWSGLYKDANARIIMYSNYRYTGLKILQLISRKKCAQADISVFSLLEEGSQIYIFFHNKK